MANRSFPVSSLEVKPRLETSQSSWLQKDGGQNIEGRWQYSWQRWRWWWLQRWQWFCQDDFSFYFGWKRMIEEEEKKKDGNDQDTVSCNDDLINICWLWWLLWSWLMMIVMISMNMMMMNRLGVSSDAWVLPPTSLQHPVTRGHHSDHLHNMII